MTKRGANDVSQNEEGGAIPEFNEMLDMDALYGGLPYPFNQASIETIAKETQPYEEVAG